MNATVNLLRWSILLLITTFRNVVGIVSDADYASLPDLFHQDNFDKCMLLGDEAFYCYFEYHLEPFEESNPTWKSIKELSSDNYNYRHDRLRHWICVPQTCPNLTLTAGSKDELMEGIKRCYDAKMSKYQLKGTIRNLRCDTNIPKYPVDTLDVLAAIFFIGYITFVLLSTMVEGINEDRLRRKFKNTLPGRIVACFSLTKNWCSLKTLTVNPDIDYLKPVQGVKFYNTVLVILSHTAMVPFVSAVFNTKYTETMNSKFANLFLSSGPLCVSTFFLLSSSMLTYGVFSRFESKKLTPKVLLMIFVNRYIRLTPALAAVLLFNVTWWRHLGSGPNWNQIVGTEYERCRKNWWTNLLFLNTAIDRTNMCTPTFWYLALDTQYFAMLLILLWYVKKYEKYIWHILGTLLTLNVAATFTENYVHDLEGLNIPRAESIYEMKNIVGNPQWHHQFISSIGNTCGSIIGVGYGYLFYKTKNVQLFMEKKQMWDIIFNILAYVPSLSAVLIPGWYVLVLKMPHDPVMASIMTATGRPIFILSIGFAIFGAMHKIGGITRDVLRWSPAYILGRVAYGAYLVHCTIIMSRAASARSPAYASDVHIIYNLLGDLTTSYLIGLILTLFVEMPISAVQKILVPTHPKQLDPTKKD